MRHPYRSAVSAVALAMALAVALSSTASAKPEGRGNSHRRESSEARGNRSGDREHSGDRQRSGDRGYSGDRQRSGDREYSGDRGRRGSGDWNRAPRPAERRGEWRTSRAPRSEQRWQDSGSRHSAPTYRSQSRYHYDRPSYSTHHTRYYYTESFCRPRFVYRSGFSLGFVIGSVPSYGYRYVDPYCGVSFRDLDSYYDHCDEHGHAELIQVFDRRTGHPVAISVYRDGDWIVDDCD